MAKLRFDGRVALITGAGGGLGREYALMFAARGASVVVNDLGVDRQGKGTGTKMADKVVEEIRAKGGKAVANYDSVEDGEKLVQTALDNFGRIDIVVNNAGIIRDRSFARISDTDWDLIHKVHLRGSFLVTRAAWPHMKKQKYGRIIMTSSASGLYGNFGQANYSAAKMGLVGLSSTVSIEGAKYNITCNTIAPIAASRLTEDIMPEEIFNLMKPEYIAPVVLYLCHEDCTETHGIFEAGAGWVGQVKIQRGKGVVCSTEAEMLTPEAVRDNWASVCDVSECDYPNAAGESTFLVVQSHEETKNQPAKRRIVRSSTAADGGFNPDLAIGQKFPSSHVTVSPNDVILYALGVGASTVQPDHLKFLFELSEDFSTLPSYGVILGQKGMANLFMGSVPGLQDIDITKILHGEQFLEVYKPIPTSGTLSSQCEVADILDKGSGALILIDAKVYDENKELVCSSQASIFLVGAGGYGGKKTSNKVKATVKPPTRAPDASIKETTTKDQAAVYRLTGDANPLHIDPSFAAMGGFAQPILHGLCSFGFSCRHVLKQYADNDVTKFKSVKCRFAKPVLPGQTIQTDMWREGNRIHFQTKVAETGTVVISGAYVDMINLAPQPAATEPSSAGGLQSDLLFQEMSRQLPNNPDVAKKAKGVFLYNLSKGGKQAGQWTVDMKTPGGAVYKGTPKNGKPDVTVNMSDEDFVAIAAGKLNPQQAFMSGRLKVKGNIMLLQKMTQLLMTNAKL
ncbi:peroxisomal multifunctional enzyme type 2-like [Patiria miniata]|uniref:Peroxisomal multifunctional enzyme type 2 n=1 Tax=Patiria miniata TaxID=46514 RepID=A0A914BPU4_PATMI|nr:peroxisomal multifunctional enzyme type 2-like [Patiria miniata]